MKKLISAFLMVLVVLSFIVPASAIESEESFTLPDYYFEDSFGSDSELYEGKIFVIDDANLFTPLQRDALVKMTEELYNNYGFELVLYTTDSAYYTSVQTYADDYYDYKGYGDNGMLFMLNLENRDYYTSTAGYAMEIFSQRKLNSLQDYVLEDLSNGQYYNAFYNYVDEVALAVEAYHNGQSYSSPISSVDKITLIKKEVVVLIIAVIIAFVMTNVLTKVLNTANKKTEANNYIRYGSFSVSHSSDTYVDTHLAKIPKADNNSRSGGGSHRSSSGRSHGGGGGKF